jgi:hypothetical protein
VQNYSRRKLTYPSDRLPALTGIASEFEKLFTPKSYTLGIWKDDSLCDLLWMDDQPSAAPARRPDWSQVASWSWASLNRPVTWHRSCLDVGLEYSLSHTPRACTIIEAEVSQFQQLILAGHFFTLGGVDGKHPLGYYNSVFIKTQQARGFSFKYMLDTWYLDSIKTAGRLGESLSDGTIQGTYIMPVLYYKGYYHKGNEDRAVRNAPGVLGLLLIRAENSGNGIFRRVGVVDVFGKDQNGRLHETVVPDKFPAAVRGFQQTLRQDDYIECDGESTYTIAII